LSYGACASAEDRSAKRISYLIGPDGKVLRAYPKVKAAEHPAQVLADLRQLKAGS
jgi:peroxiredoxin